MSSRQIGERSFQFVFPFFELYLPGVLLNIKARDIFGNDMKEVKYLDLFIANESSRTIAENLNGEAKVEIDSGSVYKNIKWEEVLIKHPDFALPGRKALLKNDNEYEIVLIDATETPIERPKKTKILLLWKKEKTHIKDPSHCR